MMWTHILTKDLFGTLQIVLVFFFSEQILCFQLLLKLLSPSKFYFIFFCPDRNESHTCPYALYYLHPTFFTTHLAESHRWRDILYFFKKGKFKKKVFCNFFVDVKKQKQM